MRVPVKIAILIQDDLTSQVANEIGVTKEFIRSLPEGSSVMVAYITTGHLQVRQAFTTDLDKAAKSLRIPLASTSASSFNPYIEVIEALKKQYGFDKPAHIRYLIWLRNIAFMDFGESFKYQEPVIDVILEKLPVSLQFGVSSLILMYLISIPLGIRKAVKDGSHFDVWSSVGLMVAYSIPPLTLGMLLRQFLATNNFLDIFPLGDSNVLLCPPESAQ